MSVVTGRPSADTEPTIYNVTLVLADTEYFQVLPEGVHGFSMQPRKNGTDEVDVFFAFETLQVPPAVGDYATMKMGAPYTKENLHTQLTIYLSCATGGTIVEIVCWV